VSRDRSLLLRRATPSLWLGLLAVLLLLGAPPSRRAPAQEQPRGAAAGADTAAAPRRGPDPATRPVPRDTTGQAELQWQVTRPGRQASLLQADRSVYRVVDGEAISYYYGNVYLDRDTVVVRADSAHVFRERDLVRLFDHVRMRHLQTRIAADWAEYRRDLGEADLRGDVRVVEGTALATSARGEMREDLQLLRLFEDAILVTPDYNVRADTLLRDRRLEYGEAFGDVRVMDPDGGSLVTGRHALFAADGSWAEVDEQPALVTSEQGGLPVQSRARTMRFFRREERAVMVDSVRIAQGQLRAYADTAISYGQERMLLLGAPRLEQGQRSRMFGDQIEFFYRDGRLHRVILLGNARMEDSEPDSLAAIYRGLPDMDVIEGDSIAVHFRQGRIARTDVVGNASSIYVPMETGDEIAYNEVAGDTLVLRFADQRVREVEVRGNMVGTYRFARVAAMRGDLAAPLDPAAVDSLSALADSLYAVGDTTAASALRRQVEAAARRLASLPPLPQPAVPDTAGLAIADTAATITAGVLGDTSAVAPPDTALAAAADTLATAAGAARAELVLAPGDTLDFTAHAEQVDYSGHSVLFDLPERSIAISEDARLVYGTMTLTARDVILDTESRELYADGDPVIEDAQTIVGQQMGYDFGNKTGAVRQGVTTFDGYYYTGKHINRYPDGSLKINSGRMTSCDLEEPHYHFWADKMKMRLDDRVVAAPIVIKVGHVPMFALPFYFKSLKDGRRSGILFPNFNFGWSEREGRYIRDFGYFWATNDYTDFTFEVDYNERRELAWRVRNRYVKRYGFNGNVEYNRLVRLDEDATAGDEWQLRWDHDQPRLWDDYKFRASVEATSRELSRNNLGSDTGRDVINTYQKSNLYVSRSNFAWGAATLSADRTQYVNAEDDDPTTDNQLYSMNLPTLSISPKRFSLAPELGPGQQGSFLGDLARNTDVNHSYRLAASQAATEEVGTEQYSASGNWSLTLRPPRIGIFNWNLGASSSWSWNRTEVAGFRYVPSGVDTIPGTWADITDVTEQTRPALSFNTGLSTTLYGVFPVRIGALQALRHTLQLSANASYRPQLGDKQPRSNSYSFRVGNRFDVKYLARSERDSTVEEKKLDGLVNWDLSTSYTPDRELAWSDVSSSVAIKAGRSRNLNFKLTNTIDPYKLALKSTRFTYSFGLAGKLDTGFAGEERVDRRSDAAALLGPAAGDTLATAAGDTAWSAEDWERWEDGDTEVTDSIYGSGFDALQTDGPQQQRDPTEGGRFIPWDVGGSFSLNRTAGADEVTARANISVNAQLTRDWSLRYTASFDLEEGATTRQEYRLQRDLHCWRLEFTRTVSTINSEFGFRFYLKAIPELKLTRGREGLLGGAGGLSSMMP